jgi:hypothetical protein
MLQFHKPNPLGFPKPISWPSLANSIGRKGFDLRLQNLTVRLFSFYPMCALKISFSVLVLPGDLVKFNVFQSLDNEITAGERKPVCKPVCSFSFFAFLNDFFPFVLAFFYFKGQSYVDYR